LSTAQVPKGAREQSAGWEARAGTAGFLYEFFNNEGIGS
jgi:hypothetical protein